MLFVELFLWRCYFLFPSRNRSCMSLEQKQYNIRKSVLLDKINIRCSSFFSNDDVHSEKQTQSCPRGCNQPVFQMFFQISAKWSKRTRRAGLFIHCSQSGFHCRSLERSWKLKTVIMLIVYFRGASSQSRLTVLSSSNVHGSICTFFLLNFTSYFIQSMNNLRCSQKGLLQIKVVVWAPVFLCNMTGSQWSYITASCSFDGTGENVISQR